MSDKRAVDGRDLKAIGRRIRELRGFDTTQEELASSLDITQGLLSRIEHGNRAPSAAVVRRLQKKYGKRVDWILTGKGK